MLVSTVRNVFVGLFTLLLVQASAMAAVISYDPGSGIDDVDAELTLVGSFNTFSPAPQHNPPNPAGASFTDYYYIDVTGDVVTEISIGSTEPPLGNPPPGFTLSMHEVTGIAGTNLTFDDVAEDALPSLPGMLITALTTGQYVLQVVYSGTPETGVGTYTGRITATPLPPALLIFGTGLFGLGFLSRYRRRRQGQLGLQA